MVWPMQISNVDFVAMKNKMIAKILEAKWSPIGLFCREFILHSLYFLMLWVHKKPRNLKDSQKRQHIIETQNNS